MQTVTTSYNKNKSNKNMNTFQVPQLTLSTNQLRQLYTPFGKELIQWMKNEMNVDGENVTFNCDADTILNRFIDHICNSTNKVAKKPTGKKGKKANKTISASVSDTDEEVEESQPRRGRPKKENVDNSVAEFLGEEVKVEKKKKAPKKKSNWMAPKRLLPKGKTDKDDDALIKEQKDQGEEGRGLSLRGLNDKPLRFKVNKDTFEVVKVNATNYTTEGNKRFKEMFPNGIDEIRMNKAKAKEQKSSKKSEKKTVKVEKAVKKNKDKIIMWKKFKTPGQKKEKVWFDISEKDITAEKKEEGYKPLATYSITTTGKKPTKNSPGDQYSSYVDVKAAYEEELARRGIVSPTAAAVSVAEAIAKKKAEEEAALAKKKAEEEAAAKKKAEEEAAALLALKQAESSDEEEEESDDEEEEEEEEDDVDKTGLDEFKLSEEYGETPLYYDSETHKVYMIQCGDLEFIGYRRENTITQSSPDTWSNEDEEQDELESMLAQMSSGGSKLYSAQLSEEEDSSSDEEED